MTPSPRPPADLARRNLPIEKLGAGEELLRIHETRHGAVHFSRGLNRWDDRAGRYGVCYLTHPRTPYGVIAETLLHDPATTVVEERTLGQLSIARIRVIEDLSLVRLYGDGLRRVGADGSVTSGGHSVSGEWGGALHDHSSEPGGILWRSRPDDDALAVGIFDRARDAIEVVDSKPLTDPAVLPQIAEWFDRYGVAII